LTVSAAKEVVVEFSVAVEVLVEAVRLNLLFDDPKSIHRHSNAVVQLLPLQFVGLTFTATLPDFAHCSLATVCAWL